MAGQNGNDFLIKMDIATVMTTIAGGNNLSIAINGETIDVTNKGSSGWQELIAGGKRNVEVSASGVWLDEATVAAAKTAALGGTIEDFEVILAGGTAGGTFTLSGRITSLNFTGENDAAITYEMSIASSGAVTFA